MIKSIVKLSLPVFLSSAVNILTLLINLRSVGNLQANNFYLLGLFSSINYLIISCIESFRATVISSSENYQEENQALRFLNSTLLISTVIFLVFALLIYIFQQQLISFLNVNQESQHTFIHYTLSMIGVSILGSWSYIILSLFYSFKKATSSLVLIISCSLLNVFLTYVFSVYLNMNIYSIPLSIFICSCLMILTGYYYLIHYGIVEWKRPIVDISSLSQSIKNFTAFGFPVFLSYIAIFTGIFIFNGILSHIDLVAVSGYGIAYRVQTLLILPAIAIGIASAIYINGSLVKRDYAHALKTLHVGLLLSMVVYVFISAVTFIFRDAIIAIIVQNASIHTEAVRYLQIVSPSYICLGPFITFLIVSEQTGRGVIGLFLNIVYFSTAIITTYLLVNKFHESSAFYYSISSINVMAFILLVLLLLIKNNIYSLKKDA